MRETLDGENKADTALTRSEQSLPEIFIVGECGKSVKNKGQWIDERMLRAAIRILRGHLPQISQDKRDISELVRPHISIEPANEYGRRLLEDIKEFGI